MSAGIRDILIIVSAEDRAYFKKLLGNGEQFGISIKYAVQKTQRGIADALLVGEKFIGGEMVTLALGDNVFYGTGMDLHIAKAMTESEGATIFCKQVEDSSAFGVVEINNTGKVISLEEKPIMPKSNWAVTGLYVYDKNACELAKTLKPSPRGELEITDLNKKYMEQTKLKAQLLGNEVLWADTGTFDSLLSTSNVIRELEKTKKIMVGCPEEIALTRGFVTKNKLNQWVSKYKSNDYYDYIRALIQQPSK